MVFTCIVMTLNPSVRYVYSILSSRGFSVIIYPYVKVVCSLPVNTGDSGGIKLVIYSQPDS